ncbi:unnamed protein product [Alternaria alternata]
MARQTGHNSGLSQPITPKRRGGQLQDLLAQFGSQSLAQSATKRRRISSQQETKQGETSDSKRSLRPQPTPNYIASDSSANEASPSTLDHKQPAVKATRSTRASTSREADADAGTSEDELAPSSRPETARLAPGSLHTLKS